MVNIMMSQQIWGYTMSETTQRMAQPQLIRGHAHVAHRNAHAQDLLQLKLHLLIYWENRLMGYVAPNICSISVVYLTLRIGERMWKVYVSNPPSPVGLSPTEIDSGDSRRHTSLNPAGGTWLRTSVTLVSRLSECCTRVGNLPACRARVILERSQKGEQWARSGKEMQRASKSMLSYPFHQLEDGCFLFPRNHPFQFQVILLESITLDTGMSLAKFKDVSTFSGFALFRPGPSNRGICGMSTFGCVLTCWDFLRIHRLQTRPR